MAAIPSAGEFAVYWLYGADGTLLYMGMTRDVRRRMREHAGQRPWWPKVVKIVTEVHPTPAKAEARENVAIYMDSPVHNVHRPDFGDTDMSAVLAWIRARPDGR